MNKNEIQTEFFQIQRGLNPDSNEFCYDNHTKLLGKLKRTQEEIIAEAFLEVYTIQQEFKYIYFDQTFAGGFLWHLAPKADFDLKESILKTIPSWDISAKELPKYYERNFGTELFRQVLRKLKNHKSNIEDFEKKLETLLYWTGLPDEPLNSKWNKIFKEKRNDWVTKGST